MSLLARSLAHSLQTMTGRGKGGKGLGKGRGLNYTRVDQRFVDMPFEVTGDTVAFNADPEGFVAVLDYANARFAARIYRTADAGEAAAVPLTRLEFAAPPGADEDLFDDHRCLLAHGERLLWIVTDSRQPGHRLLLRVSYPECVPGSAAVCHAASVHVVVQEAHVSPAKKGAPAGKKAAKSAAGAKIPGPSALLVWSHSDKQMLCFDPKKPHRPQIYTKAGKLQKIPRGSAEEITYRGSSVRLVSLFRYPGDSWRRIGGLFVRVDSVKKRLDSWGNPIGPIFGYFTLGLKPGVEWAKSKTSLPLPELEPDAVKRFQHSNMFLINYQPTTDAAFYNVLATESDSMQYGTRSPGKWPNTNYLFYRPKALTSSDESFVLLNDSLDGDVVGPFVLPREARALIRDADQNLVVFDYRAWWRDFNGEPPEEPAASASASTSTTSSTSTFGGVPPRQQPEEPATPSSSSSSTTFARRESPPPTLRLSPPPPSPPTTAMDVAIAPPPVVTQAPETLVVDNAYYMRPQHSATEACKAFGVDPEGFFATLHYGPVEDAANQFSAHVFMATAPQKPVAHFVFPPPRGSEHDYFGGYRCVLAHSEQLLWVSTDEFLLRVDYSTLSAPKILKIKFARMQDKDSSLMVWSHETKRLLCYNSDQPSMPFVYDRMGNQIALEIYDDEMFSYKNHRLILVSLFRYPGEEWRRIGGLFVHTDPDFDQHRDVDEDSDDDDDDNADIRPDHGYFTLPLIERRGPLDVPLWPKDIEPQHIHMPEVEYGAGSMLGRRGFNVLVSNYQPMLTGALLNIELEWSYERKHKERTYDNWPNTDFVLYRPSTFAREQPSIVLEGQGLRGKIVGPIAVARYGIMVTADQTADADDPGLFVDSVHVVRFEDWTLGVVFAAAPRDFGLAIGLRLTVPQAPPLTPMLALDTSGFFSTAAKPLHVPPTTWSREGHHRMSRWHRRVVETVLQIRALHPGNPMMALSEELLAQILEYL